MTEIPLRREFKDAQGVDITFFEWPVANPRAIVQLLHGLGEHARRYDEVAAVLNKSGYSVFATDHRGHGETGIKMLGQGLIKQMGNLGVGGMKAVFANELELRDMIAAEHPGVPLVLLGHSWGSMIAQRILNWSSNLWSAAVLTGSTLLLPGILPSGGFNRAWKSEINPTGYEWLSRDRKVGEAFITDPKTFPEGATKVFGLKNSAALLGLPSKRLRSDLPILLLAGSDDPIGGEKGNRMLANEYAKSGIQDIRFISYHRGRHEVFNETNRLEVFADLIAWLDEKLPTR
jgi:alpha-beta hydrolase superfamily lysophospholipase